MWIEIDTPSRVGFVAVRTGGEGHEDGEIAKFQSFILHYIKCSI